MKKHSAWIGHTWYTPLSEKEKKIRSNKMKMNNPMHNAETRKKVSEHMKKHSFLINRKIPKKEREAMSKRMKEGGAIHALSFAQKISKPQIKLFELVKQIFPNAVIEYACLNRSIDIAIPNKMIAIEYDGSYWHQNKEEDDKRQKELEKMGWNFLRYLDYLPTIAELKKDLENAI